MNNAAPSQYKNSNPITPGCANSLACNLFQPASEQFYPNTSISSVPVDADGWHFVGETTISSGPLVSGTSFNIGADDQIQITTFSSNLVSVGGIGQGPAFLSPFGTIQVNVEGCGWLSCTSVSQTVGVITMQTITVPFSVPRNWSNVGYPYPGGNRVTVLPTIITPRATRVIVRSR
jgi:hypothetical protein